MIERLIRYAIFFGMRRDKHARLEQWYKLTPQAGRRLFARTTSRIPRPKTLTQREEKVAGVPGSWISMTGVATDKVILYLHGGGYAIGSVQTHLGLTAALARSAGIQVFSAEYRLAPEYPFPAGIEDGVAVYAALSERFGSENIVISGDSAGGGLVLATLLEARRLGLVMPASVYLLSPWTDLTLSGASYKNNADTDDLLSPQELEIMRDYYLQGEDPAQVLASPVFADYTGFPPVLIQASKIEMLLDDSLRLAQNMEKAGVNVVVQTWSGMPHVWQILDPFLTESRAALESAGKFIEQQWEYSV